MLARCSQRRIKVFAPAAKPGSHLERWCHESREALGWPARDAALI